MRSNHIYEPLNREQVYNLCRKGPELRLCKFIMQGASGQFCTKGTEHEKVIRKRLSEAQPFSNKIDDGNCSGPPDFIPVDLATKTNAEKTNWELWQEICNREDLVDGIFTESNINGYIYIGPLKRIWIDGQDVHIENEWISVLKSKDANWERCNHNPICHIRINDNCPDIRQDDVVFFPLKFVGTILLYPREYNFDPILSKGLKQKHV